MEKSFHGIRHRPPDVNQLEGTQLRLDFGYCGPSDENGALRANSDHNKRSKSGRSDH